MYYIETFTAAATVSDDGSAEGSGASGARLAMVDTAVTAAQRLPLNKSSRSQSKRSLSRTQATAGFWYSSRLARFQAAWRWASLGKKVVIWH